MSKPINEIKNYLEFKKIRILDNFTNSQTAIYKRMTDNTEFIIKEFSKIRNININNSENYDERVTELFN